MPDLLATLKTLLRDVITFAHQASGVKLRNYQEQVAAAIARSVIEKQGLTFVVIFPRQSGKNELQAQIECYLLTLYSNIDGELVKISPTWKPQSLNAMRRLERVLKRNLMARHMWSKESGYIYKVNTARIYFLSGSPTANIVGSTASTLLECDEAQDVTIEKWDKEIAPMAASANATRVLWGTAWTSQTLLAREKRAALEAQRLDGIQRVFEINAELVKKEAPAYGKFVDQEIAKHGRNHPFIKSQFFSEEIDAETGMFPPERIALLKGNHPYQDEPLPGHSYAFLLDVAGEETGIVGAGLRWRSDLPLLSSRDSTALTIVEVDLTSLSDPLINAPIYRIVHRKQWTGERHTNLFSKIKALAELWQPRRIVIDATGIGEPLASFLDKAFPGGASGAGAIIPFKFTQQSKSDLGWKFIGLIETGRLKDHTVGADGVRPLDTEFYRQLSATQMEILPGPGKTLRWSVPDGTRDTRGQLIHDDLVLSAALVSVLDEETWGTAESVLVQPIDPLKELAF